MKKQVRELVEKAIKEEQQRESELMDVETAEQERIAIQKEQKEMSQQMQELVEAKYERAKEYPTGKTFCR